MIIHSAIPGGVERFLYVMFDGFKKEFPLWLHPVQLRLLPVNQDFVQDCRDLVRQFDKLPLRIEIDDRDLSVSAKLKAAYEDLVPHKVIIGQREKQDDFAAVRSLVDQLVAQCGGKPSLPRSWPAELNKQY